VATTQYGSISTAGDIPRDLKLTGAWRLNSVAASMGFTSMNYDGIDTNVAAIHFSPFAPVTLVGIVIKVGNLAFFTTGTGSATFKIVGGSPNNVTQVLTPATMIFGSYARFSFANPIAVGLNGGVVVQMSTDSSFATNPAGGSWHVWLAYY